MLCWLGTLVLSQGYEGSIPFRVTYGREEQMEAHLPVTEKVAGSTPVTLACRNARWNYISLMVERNFTEFRTGSIPGKVSPILVLQNFALRVWWMHIWLRTRRTGIVTSAGYLGESHVIHLC